MTAAAASEPRLVSVQKVKDILREVHEVLSPEKYDILESLLESYVGLTRALSGTAADLARLRRLFRLETSERLENLNDEEGSSNAREAADAVTEEDASGPSDEETTPAPPKLPRKKKKGHGRRPGTDYTADNTHTRHSELEVGGCCPHCDRKGLYHLRDSEPMIRLFGQAAILAKSWTFETLRCPTCGACFSPELPEEAKGPKYANSAMVALAFMHYALGMPLERLEQWQASLGVPMPASIQWDLLDDAARTVAPVVEILKAAAATSNLLHIDDTTMRILQLMGKRRPAAIAAGLIPDPNRTGIFTTGVLALGSQAPPVALFFTGIRHAGENLEALLELRPPDLAKPIVMSDALNRNIPASVKDRVIMANCMAHGRRGVFDQNGSFPREARYVLEQLAEVFALDSEARQHGLTPEERLRLHQRRSGARLGRLRQWIRRQLDRDRTIEPNSELGRSLRYILKHWTKLTLFLRRPGVPLTNNICERLLKTSIRYRKNSGFYKTVRGAQVGDSFMSIFQTARLNEVNPVVYLNALLDNATKVAEAPDQWLPWNYTDALLEVSA